MQEKKQEKEVFSRVRPAERQYGSLHFADNRPQATGQKQLIRQIQQMPLPFTTVRQCMKENGESEKASSHLGLLRTQNGIASSSSSVGSEAIPSLTYHHIIDKDSLMYFWNALRKIRIGEEAMKEFEDMILHLIERSKQHADTSASYEADGKEVETTDLQSTAVNSVKNSGPINRNWGEIIERMYQWMPGNIFSGPLPENRWHVGGGPGTDDQKDPNNGFETGAQYILPKEQYNRLFKLNEEISETVEVADKVESLQTGISKCTASKSGVKKKDGLLKKWKSLLPQKEWVERWLDLSFIRLWLIADLNAVTPYNASNWIKTDPAGHTPGDPEYDAGAAKYLIVRGNSVSSGL